MTIETLFKKPIDRNIEGVVKADNEDIDAIRQEVEEYVVTNELNARLDDFFRVYASSITKPTGDNGVWISGFFGSGKSHLLKILSYILSNKSLENEQIAKIFEEKIEKDDFELRGNINKSLSIPAETILFNIDQKAESLTVAHQDDKLLSVFLKVFNDHRGYYGKFPHIAAFEAMLDDEGEYERFKQLFQEAKNIAWDKARETLALYKEPAASALSTVRNIPIEDAKRYIDGLKESFKTSIEDFAMEVTRYIERKDSGFRLIFCVDEIGQYIGDDTKLMLNLQTIVESLATKTNGRAWVLVTSQADIDSLLENRDDRLSNDFSKIMGRFKVKINLTSKDADEVIQKRLLDKNDAACTLLGETYTRVQNTLRSIIHFENRQFGDYKDASHFIATYPFIPYQFSLFGQSIRGLSAHGAFQGAHQSVGERSMLGVFQDVVKSIAKDETGSLISYDKFFDGLKQTIKGEIQTSILMAENHLDDPFALRVLKILFMVKYVKGFTPTVDSISTLMVDTFDVNIAGLKEEILRALTKLTDQVYIQKIADSYEFLTDKEKDIENEIKDTQCPESDITKELADWVFDDIIRVSKLRFEGNRNDYPFEKKMDGNRVKGKEENIVVHVMTPLGSADYPEDRLVHYTMANKEIVFLLEPNRQFEKDLRLYVQTKKFLPQKMSASLSEMDKLLLASKQTQNTQRRSKLIESLKSMMEDSKIYFNGAPMQVTAKEAKNRVESAFNQAITAVFPQITMLRKNYSEDDIKAALFNQGDLGFGDETMNEAENEIFMKLSRAKAEHKTLTIAAIIGQFEDRPYGWYQNAVLSLLASLFARGKIELRQNTPLERNEAFKALTNSRDHTSTTVSPTKQVDDARLKKVRSIATELFPDMPQTQSAKELFENTRQSAQSLVTKLESFKSSYSYPFLASLSEGILLYTQLGKVDMDDFFETMESQEDALLDAKEAFIEPILEFFNGSKFDIYKKVSAFLRDNADNLKSIADSKVNDLYALMKDEKPYIGSKIQSANESLQAIQAQIDALIQSARAKANSAIEEKIAFIQAREDFSVITPTDKNQVLSPLLARQKGLETIRQIDSIHYNGSEETLSKIVGEALELAMELAPIPPVVDGVKPIVKKQIVRLSALTPKTRSTLTTASDVDEYINRLRENLLSAINEQKEVIL